MHKIRLLCAFQALEIMGKYGGRKAYGVTKTTARKIIFDLTGVKIKRGQHAEGSTVEDYFESIGYTWRDIP